MPWAPAPLCASPGCRERSTRDGRGRCALHRRSEAERGYGQDWRTARAAVRATVRECQRCGARDDLTVDHIRPQSMGGTHARANLRVLCRECHGAIGAQRNRPVPA